ncbi:MAG: response regulator transcription factor, partial [Actinomycetota bacterium]
MPRILVIEDEPNLRLLLDRLFGGAGLDVVECETGMSGLATALTDEFDLIVLDLTLPDVAGEHVLHMLISQKPWARVLVLSSVTEVGRRVAAFEGGALDFVAKPFSNAELLTRIRIRMSGERSPAPPSARRSGQASGITLDVGHRALIADGKRIGLSQREFVLLTYLLDRKGEVCSRPELLNGVWDMDFDPGTNVVDVYVRRLRAKLGESAIETIRNVG